MRLALRRPAFLHLIAAALLAVPGLGRSSPPELLYSTSDQPFAGTSLLRIGLGSTVELHARADSPPTPMIPESSTDPLRRLYGFTDVSLGAQWRVRGGDAGWLPGVAWLADIESGGGKPAFRGPDFRPSLRATAEWALPQDMTVGVMPGFYRDRDEDSGRHYAAGVMALTLGKAWTPSLRSFVEVAGERLGASSHDGASLNLDTGLAFRASQTMQVNMVISHSVSGEASALRAGMSLSSRF